MQRNLPSPDLARAFVDAQPGSRDALLDAWIPVVLRWAAGLGGPRTDAEDVTQEVFIVVLRRLADIDDVNGFPAWLFGITRKVVAQHRRRAWVRRWVPGASTDTGAVAEGPDVPMERAELGRRVQELLERLPAKQREVLVLCDLEERSASEAAELLGIPSGTVKSRLRLGRERFRRLAHATDLPLPFANAPEVSR